MPSSLVNLPEETMVSILQIVQADELRRLKTVRNSSEKKSIIVSKSLMNVRLVCKWLRHCADLSVIEVLISRGRHMASLFGRIEAKISFMGEGIRPFGLPRMKYTYISNHTACLDSLWSHHGNRCLPFFGELRVHQRIYICPSFLTHYGEIFGVPDIFLKTVEVVPKGIAYPFDVNSLELPSRVPGSRPLDVTSGVSYISDVAKRANEARWGKMLYGKRRSVRIGTLVYLLGRTRTWSVDSTRRDLFPSHIPRSEKYIISEGPHSKKDSPCFIRGDFTLVKPSIQLGANFIPVSEVREISLSYIDIGCVATFLRYFSGLKKIVLGERVLGRSTLERAILESKKGIEVFNNFRHV